MKCKVTHAGQEIKLKEVAKKSDMDKLKVNNPTLERAKKVRSILKEEIGK